jgi:DNA-binding MarR family transcriptional regulator
MLQEQLDLTNEQATVVQEILIDGQETITEIIGNYGLQRSDMRMVRREMSKVRQQYPEKLTAVLDEEQLQTLLQEIFAIGPLEFLSSGKDEKLVLVQDLLGLSEEKAGLVVTILEEGEMQRQKVLENSGFNPLDMVALRLDITEHSQNLKRNLYEILNSEQMEQFEKLSSRIRPWSREYEPTFEGQGDQL